MTTGRARGDIRSSFAAHCVPIHSGRSALAYQRGLRIRHGANDGEHGPAHGTVGVHLILDADKAHAEMTEPSSAISRCRVLRANRSNFQTSTQSIS